MISKIFDVRTSRDGEIIDALSVNQADVQVLNSILILAQPGDEVLLICKVV